MHDVKKCWSMTLYSIICIFYTQEVICTWTDWVKHYTHKCTWEHTHQEKEHEKTGRKTHIYKTIEQFTSILVASPPFTMGTVLPAWMRYCPTEWPFRLRMGLTEREEAAATSMNCLAEKYLLAKRLLECVLTPTEHVQTMLTAAEIPASQQSQELIKLSVLGEWHKSCFLHMTHFINVLVVSKFSTDVWPSSCVTM